VQQNKERYRNQVEEKIKLTSKLCKHFSMGRAKKGRRGGGGRGKMSKRRGGMKRGAKSMKSVRKQKGGAIAAGLALGMLAPMLLGTVGKILKVNV
jgi:hypothetical protein